MSAHIFRGRQIYGLFFSKPNKIKKIRHLARSAARSTLSLDVAPRHDHEEDGCENQDNPGYMDGMESLIEDKDSHKVCRDRLHAAQQRSVRAADAFCGMKEEEVRHHCRERTQKQDVDSRPDIGDRIESDRSVLNDVIDENYRQGAEENIEHCLEIVDVPHPRMIQENYITGIAQH